MIMSFPIQMTFAEAAALPDIAEPFGWDESMIEEDEPDTTLAGTIEVYSTAYHSSIKLSEYLRSIGFVVCAERGINIRNEAALRTANALFNQISSEYDDPDIEQIEVTHLGSENRTYVSKAPPTWAMFGLGGDDDCDYCGGQPSCLTEYLISLCTSGDLT